MKRVVKTKGSGRIITFYSYKGGTGRSMAVANLAWILASNGHRVLAIDWDLEAPGLHRFLHPFLDDNELISSPGLIDYFMDFSAAAASQAHTSNAASGVEPWWLSWTSLLRYTYSIEWDEFPGHGTIDLVPAGRQGPDYGVRVTSFDWRMFYEKLGGGVLLEALKSQLRIDYDYILIDSRTGISDTSGICTVQMPDHLVVLFTLNRQSISGAAAVADYVDGKRRKITGEPGLHIWPIPTRIDIAEKERMDAAKEFARGRFAKHLGHLGRQERRLYWGKVQVQYQPFFAYEEILAPFAENPTDTSSMLSQMLEVARFVAAQPRLTFPQIPAGLRQTILKKYSLGCLNPAVSSRSAGIGIYISYRYHDEKLAKNLIRLLRKHNIENWWDQEGLALSDDAKSGLTEELRECDLLIVIMSGTLSRRMEAQKKFLLSQGKPVFMVMPPGSSQSVAPEVLPKNVSTVVLMQDTLENDLAHLVMKLRNTLDIHRTQFQLDPEDPQKGRWGGKARNNGRILAAKVKPISDNWFLIILEVRRVSGAPLSGEVEFHLHPSFGEKPHRIARLC